MNWDLSQYFLANTTEYMLNTKSIKITEKLTFSNEYFCRSIAKNSELSFLYDYNFKFLGSPVNN